MDNQTKESKDLKFRQWAESIEKKEKSKTSRKTVERPVDPMPSKTPASEKSVPMPREQSELPVSTPSAPVQEKTPTREDQCGKEDREEEEDVEEEEYVEERDVRRGREDRNSRKRIAPPPRPPQTRKKGSPVLVAIIVFLLAIIVFLCLFIVRGKANRANTVSEEPASEIAAVPPSDPAADQGISAVPNTVPQAQPSGITIVVPAEYALYGRTDYLSMTQAEYDQLLSGVHQYIDVQLKAFTKLKDPYYPHFDSLTANDDCTVYTVTVNEAGARSQKELALHEQLPFFTKMYAAYSQQSVSQFEIHYQTYNGTVLKTEAFTLDGTAIDTAAPTAPVPAAAVPAPTTAVPTATPTTPASA